MNQGTSGWVGGSRYDSNAYSDETLKEEPLPRDVYLATVVKAEAAQTKEGKPCVNVTLNVTQTIDGEANEFSRRVRDGLYFIGKNADAVKLLRRRHKQVSDALDIGTPEGDTFEDLERFAKAVLESGKNGVAVVIKTEKWNRDDGSSVDQNKVEQWLMDSEVEAAVKRVRKNGNGKAGW